MSVITLPPRALTYPQAYATLFVHRRSITKLAKDIANDGLLNPVLVRRNSASVTPQFNVIDGKKRMIAIKALGKAGRLPRSLINVPCIEVDNDNSAPSVERCAFGKPMLKTDAEFTNEVCTARANGWSRAALAARFDCAEATIDMATSLISLHAQIRDYFNSGHLSLEQAAAFATLPNPQAQWALLQNLGPFAHAHDVIAAILAGETVIDMPDGQVMILPSRARPDSVEIKAMTRVLKAA